jgi:hypothetical protein
MTKSKKDKNWIAKADIKKGAFTKKAAKKGITTAQLQENVLANPEDYDKSTVKQANLRKTLVSLKKKKYRKAEED